MKLIDDSDGVRVSRTDPGGSEAAEQSRSPSLHEPTIFGFRQGVPGALATAYRLYSPGVSRFLRRAVVRLRLTVGDGMIVDPEDLVQEVFMRAFRTAARESFDRDGDYQLFLAVIARNVLLDHYRSRRVERRLLRSLRVRAPDAALAVAPVTRDPLAVANLRKTIRTLTVAQNDVLRLRFCQELSQRSAATALGLSRQEIRTLEGTIRLRIRDALAPRAAGAGDGHGGPIAKGASRVSPPRVA